MKTPLIRWFLAALFAALPTAILAVPSHAAGATTLRIPLAGTLSSTAGPLTLSGSVHLVLPPNPVAPPNPVRVETNLVQVSASNDRASCPARGAQQFTLDTATTPFTGSYQFIPSPPPIAPDDPCGELGSLIVDYQLTVTENGTVTGATAVPRTTT